MKVETPTTNLAEQWQAQQQAFLNYLASLTTGRLASLRIATLGPAESASALLATKLLRDLVPSQHARTECVLCLSYERAFASMLMGESDLFLVTNAYEQAHFFHESPRAALLWTFMYDLPPAIGLRKATQSLRTSWSLFVPRKY